MLLVSELVPLSAGLQGTGQVIRDAAQGMMMYLEDTLFLKAQHCSQPLGWTGFSQYLEQYCFFLKCVLISSAGLSKSHHQLAVVSEYVCVQMNEQTYSIYRLMVVGISGHYSLSLDQWGACGSWVTISVFDCREY